MTRYQREKLHKNRRMAEKAARKAWRNERLELDLRLARYVLQYGNDHEYRKQVEAELGRLLDQKRRVEKFNGVLIPCIIGLNPPSKADLRRLRYQLSQCSMPKPEPKPLVLDMPEFDVPLTPEEIQYMKNWVKSIGESTKEFTDAWRATI